jgi:hypothetical protein
MKKVLFLLFLVSLNSFAVDLGEDLKGDCADGNQKSRSTASSESTSTSSSVSSDSDSSASGI